MIHIITMKYHNHITLRRFPIPYQYLCVPYQEEEEVFVDPLSDFPREEQDCFVFVETMLALLRAVNKYAVDRHKLGMVKKEAAKMSMASTDCKEKNLLALARYQDTVKNRYIIVHTSMIQI